MLIDSYLSPDTGEYIYVQPNIMSRKKEVIGQLFLLLYLQLVCLLLRPLLCCMRLTLKL